MFYQTHTFILYPLLIIFLTITVACTDDNSMASEMSLSDMMVDNVADTRMVELPDAELLATDQETLAERIERLDELYSVERLLEVSITMDERDWDELSAQSRTFVDLFDGPDCLDQPFESVFTWFEASVSLDGQLYPRVEVRKKGFFGSLSEDKPGLKIDLGEFEDGQNYMGARRLTLNNAVQDPAIIRQCLGYEIIESAGIPAPRCNFAKVEVNGQPMGIYVNIEPYKRPFFEERFGSYEGNLYEGTISDFTERGINTFEPKNNDDERRESPDLLAVRDALTGDTGGLIDRLDEVMDVEQFIRFWALESLLLHSDGYSGNRNNFYIYGLPEREGRFQFLLWGIDGVLRAYDVADGDSQSVYQRGAITWLLYQDPEGRRRYFAALNDLLDTVWDEALWVSRIEEMSLLLSDWIDDTAERDFVESEIELLTEIFRARRGEIEEELAMGDPEVIEELEGLACLVPFGSTSASFDTTWGLINQDPSEWFMRDGQRFEVILDADEDPLIRTVGSAAGSDDEFGPRLNILGSLGLNEFLLLNVSLEEENWRSGDQEVWSELYYSGAESDYEIVYIASAFVEMNLEQGGSGEGDPIIGSLSGLLRSWSE